MPTGPGSATPLGTITLHARWEKVPQSVAIFLYIGLVYPISSQLPIGDLLCVLTHLSGPLIFFFINN